MATGTLTGTTIEARYKSLLKITGTANDVFHATTLKIIEDGDGNNSCIQLAQNRVEIVPVVNHANAFEVSQADGTQIFNIASDTPALIVNAATVTLTQDTNFVLTGGTNGMSIDGTTFSVDGANNRVGIGTASPDNPLEVVGGFKCGSTSATSGFNDHAIILCDSGTAYEGGLLITQQDSAAADKSSAKFNVTSSAASGTADMTIGVVDNEAPNTYIRRWFYCDGATGNVNIGTDDTPTSRLVVRNDADFLTATVNVLHIMDNHATVDTADVLARFDFSADADVDGARALSFHDSGGEIGSITLDGNATAFNTSSDYRLKTDLKDIVDATGTINKLKLYDFAWKKNTSKRLTGIIAHEAAEIVPYAIRGEKDAMTVDDDGESVIDAQGADYSKFVPLLLKSIQELSASNDALKARIEVLEAA